MKFLGAVAAAGSFSEEKCGIAAGDLAPIRSAQSQ